MSLTPEGVTLSQSPPESTDTDAVQGNFPVPRLMTPKVCAGTMPPRSTAVKLRPVCVSNSALAALLMVPLLTLFADLIGILGGALTMITFNIPILSFLHEVDSLVDVKDLMAGLAKAPVFAILIAGIGCLRGLQTQTGASAVGISATRAVVSSIVLLVVVDGIYAFVYYLLDI